MPAREAPPRASWRGLGALQRALWLPVCQEDRARRRVLRDRRARSADHQGDLRPLHRAARVDHPDRAVAHRAGCADQNRNSPLGPVNDLGDPPQPRLHRPGGLRSPARDRRPREADARDTPAGQAFRSLRLRARRARALAADPRASADHRGAARARARPARAELSPLAAQHPEGVTAARDPGLPRVRPLLLPQLHPQQSRERAPLLPLLGR